MNERSTTFDTNRIDAAAADRLIALIARRKSPDNAAALADLEATSGRLTDPRGRYLTLLLAGAICCTRKGFKSENIRWEAVEAVLRSQIEGPRPAAGNTLAAGETTPDEEERRIMARLRRAMRLLGPLVRSGCRAST